jgi:methyltransferase (TIGR00027 family)
MTTDGIEAVFLETHNWGRAAKFFQALGYELEFATDHNSGQLRNGDGPYVFIAEVPESQELREPRLVLQVADGDAFRAEPPVEVVTEFADTHWGTREMTVRDPDGRLWSLQAPARALKEGAIVTLRTEVPDNTAVRVALWRAMHVQVDAAPHVLEDEIGLQLAAPDENWRARPDMDPDGTRGFRASIVGRARFVEDLVVERADVGVGQYVVLGAGLDTFAQRHPAIGTRVRVFEIDEPATQQWKRERLADLGYGQPDWLRFVPVDFEAGGSWWDALVAAGFDADSPAVVASIGVTMYLTREAIAATLRQVAAFATGSTLVMSFMLPFEQVDAGDRPAVRGAESGARAAGTPWISFFTPEQMLDLARGCGFRDVRHVAGSELGDRYFAGRADGLLPARGEDFLVATTT